MDGRRGQGGPPGGTDGDRDLFGRAPRGRADWSHRRGEPRLFAVLWMLYLMAASGLMLSSVSAARFVSPEITRPAARAMLVAAMAGVCVVWPVVRLSQEAPRRAGVGVGKDLLVLLIPLYALVLPQGFWFLSNWPATVVGALCLLFTGWAALVGAVLSVALRSLSGARVVWAVVFVGLALAGPAASWAGLGGAMSWPVTGVLELTAGREGSGQAARVPGEHWRALGALFVGAGAAWGVSSVVGLVLGGRRA